MRHGLLGVVLLVGASALAAADPPADQPAAQFPVVKLAVKPGPAEPRTLKYTLLPDPLDLTPGNAAPMWTRAGESASAKMRDLSQGPNKVVAPKGTPLDATARAGDKPVPLKDLDKDEIRAYLAHFATALRLADQAARYDHCDWQMPPLTMQDIADFPLDDIQHLRTVAGLLSTRYLLELSEGRFDDALRTLQTGFALARDVGQGDTLIQDLVGIAIGAIMFGHVQQWEEQPGSPNLFWALTDLPAPLVNPAHAMRMEMTTLYRTFPALRQVLNRSDKGLMTEEETNRVVSELYKEWGRLIGQDVPEWQQKLAAAALILKTHPDAKKFLKERGWSDEKLEAMPAAQAVLLYFVQQNDEIKDDFLKWTNVPPWQALPGMAETEKRLRVVAADNPIIRLLLPAVQKVYEARVRIEHTADYLRCAEAIRLYAQTHDGKPPAKLEDVKLPLPTDPYTGEGYGKFYKVEADGTAVFEVPPPPNMPPSLGRRFELAPPAK
jgi:hypothetical protein